MTVGSLSRSHTAGGTTTALHVKQAESVAIEKHIDAFKAAGGKIEVLGTTMHKDRTDPKAAARGRKNGKANARNNALFVQKTPVPESLETLVDDEIEDDVEEELP